MSQLLESSSAISISHLNHYYGTGSLQKQVLFDIEADPHLVNEKPFADISSHSYFL